jgi:glycine cleavage system H protein
MNILNYEFPEDRLYDKEHCWVKKDGDNARIGVTDFFQKTANEIVFIELPATGRDIETGKNFVSLESGKWVGRVKSSMNGAVVNANTELNDFPYLLNDSPYDEGWIVDVKPSDNSFEPELFDLKNPDQRAAFEQFIKDEEERIASMSK